MLNCGQAYTLIVSLTALGQMHAQSQNMIQRKEYIKWYNGELKYNITNDLLNNRSNIQFSMITRKPELEIDQAWFTVNSSVSFDLEIWAQSHACHKCDLMYITYVAGFSGHSLPVNCTHKTDLRLVRVHPGGHPEQLCRFQTTFREDGDYWVFIDYPDPPDDELIKCELILANDPPAAELRDLSLSASFQPYGILLTIMPSFKTQFSPMSWSLKKREGENGVVKGGGIKTLEMRQQDGKNQGLKVSKNVSRGFLRLSGWIGLLLYIDI
ncbi:heparan-alpha-glucosaminide n-acetyltransferase [Plakobranchus ocellatus]|uniref:Heparan-alpha-glucosaminide n-acetyltransferase n=1 Tax=Plakobranchus ocellatus TaxID=259542 RepID=A0AAV4D0S9_9GAST|nr:heparan-alpha-glucosaminide n-acetyltransferase [Plakobranchus ocellatus]